MDIRFLGHAAFELTDGDTTVLIDPFLTGNPKAAVDGRRGRADARSCSPTATATTSATPSTSPSARARPWWRSSRSPASSGEQGVENVRDPNLGGTVEFDWGWVKLVPAWHTSTTPNGTVTHARRAA